MNKQMAITISVVACFGTWLGLSYLMSRPGASEPAALVRHIATPIFGCKSRDTVDRISELLGQHKRDAVIDLVNANLATGECDDLAKGQEITVEQSAIGLLKVRRPGDAAGYWTVSEAVGP